MAFRENEHPRAGDGKFTETAKSEPTVGLAASSTTRSSIALRMDAQRIRENAARMMQQDKAKIEALRNEVGSLAATQVALSALEHFPDAASIRLRVDGNNHIVLTGVMNADGETIASEHPYRGPEYEALAEWLSTSRAQEIAADMPGSDADWWEHATELPAEPRRNSEWLLDIRGAALQGARTHGK